MITHISENHRQQLKYGATISFLSRQLQLYVSKQTVLESCCNSNCAEVNTWFCDFVVVYSGTPSLRREVVLIFVSLAQR
jgi:hypothetical protein